MAKRAFLFLVARINLAGSAKQKSSAPPPTHDEFTPAQRASRFDWSLGRGLGKGSQTSRVID